MGLKSFLRKPSLYGFLYIAQIFVFATIYNSMQGQFYAPYAKDEFWSVEDKQFIVKTLNHLLETKIQNAVEEDQKDLVQSDKPARTYIPTLSVSGISDISFDNDNYLHLKGQFNSKYSWPVDVSCQFHIRQIQVDLGLSKAYTWLLCTYNEFITVSSYFNDKKVRHFSLPLILKADIMSKISLYRRGVNGDPTTLGHSWFRMLYFSVVVNTTVGFGDIVPMTDIARAIAALQVVLGIIWAGFFFNFSAQPSKNE